MKTSVKVDRLYGKKKLVREEESGKKNRKNYDGGASLKRK